MSIRQGLLALLAEAPMYGYQLRSEFEARTGGTWPLNIGQVYTTLARLERDDLVAPAGATDDGNERWALTDDGRAELTSWWATPVSRDAPARDELATLAAVGASPQVRLRVAGAQAGVVSVLGVLLGVLAGAVLGAVVVLMNRFPALGFDPTWVIVVPWAQLSALVVGVPALAIAAGYAFTRSWLPMVRRVGQ